MGKNKPTFTAQMFTQYINTFVMRIIQGGYENFTDSIKDLISHYRKEFSLPVTIYWREYHFFHREKMRVWLWN